MSSELLTPSDCQLIVDDLDDLNDQDRTHAPHTPESVKLIRQRGNIIAKLQLKARAADATK